MLVALALFLLGAAAAFLPVYLGLPDLPQLLGLLLMVLGVGWAWLVAARAKGWLRVAAALLLTAATGAYGYWFFGLSVYGRPRDVAPVGKEAPQIRAQRVKDGAVFRLSEYRGRDVVLVFFRGTW